MEQREAMQYLYEVFDASLPRLGPGNKACTIKALDTLLPAGHEFRSPPLSRDLKILDIGCGNGAQTIQLAKQLEGTITALDNHKPYLKELMRRAEDEGIADRIRPYEKDMHNHGLEGKSFHLIWAEGSLFVIDFKNGLSVCRDLLVHGGLMAASELCWLRKDAPTECRQFFADEYPAITDVSTNLSYIKDAGLETAGHFILPEVVWWDDFYTPIAKRLLLLQEKYREDPQRLEFIDSVKREISICRRFSDFYGYVFYLMRRP